MHELEHINPQQDLTPEEAVSRGHRVFERFRRRQARDRRPSRQEGGVNMFEGVPVLLREVDNPDTPPREGSIQVGESEGQKTLVLVAGGLLRANQIDVIPGTVEQGLFVPINQAERGDPLVYKVTEADSGDPISVHLSRDGTMDVVHEHERLHGGTKEPVSRPEIRWEYPGSVIGDTPLKREDYVGRPAKPDISEEEMFPRGS